jgi:hypothetical protein
VGGALERSVRNRIRTIVEHLLRPEHSPAVEPRAGWRATVRIERVGLRDALTPTLRREAESEVSQLYEDAGGLAEGTLRDHGKTAAADALPAACPYSFDQIISIWLPK